jgi:hypothetical protein
VLLATFSIRPHHATTEALSPPFSHFDPFGTEFREPGRISHPTIQLQRSFQLAPEFLATSRQSRLHSSHADTERGRDFFIRKTFNVSQNHCFSINSLQTSQSLFQSPFSFTEQHVLFGIPDSVGFERCDQTQAPPAYFRRID